MKNRLNLTLEQKQQQRLLPLQLRLGKMLELNDREIDDLIIATVDENPALIYKFNEDRESPRYSSDGETDQVETYDFAAGINYRNGFTPRYDISESQTGDINNHETLLENVVRQLKDLELTAEELALGEYMAASLDSNGYFTRTKAGLSDDILMQSGEEPNQEMIEKVWDSIRAMDPPGIGATDLRDCLLLQLHGKTQISPIISDAIKILTDSFNGFLKQDIGLIKEQTGLDERRISDALKTISRLNPKPGREFLSSSTEINELQVNPDLSVLPNPYNGNRLTISFTSELPELAIEESFSDVNLHNTEVSDTVRQQNREAALFMKERVEEAKNFIQLLKMRNETLYNVTKAIVARQKDFFQTGDPLDLRPMVLKDIAADTGYDLSVLSRATSNRYLTTIGGIVSFKSLFHEKRNDGSTGGTTALKIMETLRQLIESENKTRPYSDDELVELLTEKGVSIARRTVAKYRENLGIESARKRKITVLQPN